MAKWPAQGERPWDDALKAYIDTEDAAVAAAAQTSLATSLADHQNQASNAHDASAMRFTPVPGITATDVQTAIQQTAGSTDPALTDTQVAGFVTGPSQTATAIATHPEVTDRLRITEAPLSPARYGGNLQATLTAAGTAGGGNLGGQVYIPAGEYIEPAGLVVPDSVSVRGAGQRATRIRTNGAATCLEVGKESRISDLYLVGNKTVGGRGVKFRPLALHTTLADMSINGFDTGTVCEDSIVLQFDNVSQQANNTGLRFIGDYNNAIVVKGGEIQGNVTGVVNDSAGSCWGLKFLGTTVEGNSGRGFVFNGPTFGLAIRDVYMESNMGGHIDFASSNHYGALLDGNLLINGGLFGIHAGDGVGIRNINVKGNTFNLTTALARSLYLGTGANGALVEGNHYEGSTLAFDPAVDFKGVRLTHLNHTGALTLRPSANSIGEGGAPLRMTPGVAPANPNNGDVWLTSSGLYYHAGGATYGPTPREATSAQLADANSSINTVGKARGLCVFNTTAFAPLWARGSNATSGWVDGMGNVVITPA